MKNIYLLFSLTLFIYCCTEKKEKQKNTNRPIISSEKAAKKKVDKTIIEVFHYTFKEENDIQTLDITWLSADTIEFKLIAESEPCRFEQYGIAIRKSTNDPEIDEDSDGNSYPVIEYFVEEKGQLISIFVELGIKSKAQINYVYSEPLDECDPFDVVMLKTKSN